MMAIATIRLKLTMIEARLSVGQADVFAQLRHGGVQHDAMGARRKLQSLHSQCRHQQHRAQQQRGDRGITEHRQAADGRQPRQRRTQAQQREAEVRAGSGRHRVVAIAAFQRARRRLGAPRLRAGSQAPMLGTTVPIAKKASSGSGAARSDAPTARN